MKYPKVFFYISTAAYMIFIAYMSLIRLESPDEPTSEPKRIFFNSLHVPAYALLAFLWVHSLKDTSRKNLFFAFVISVGYGILMEYLQTFTPYRSWAVDDIMRNAIGAGLVAGYYLIRKDKVS